MWGRRDSLGRDGGGAQPPQQIERGSTQRSLLCPLRQRSTQAPTRLVQIQSHECVHPHVMRIHGRVQIWSLPEQCLDNMITTSVVSSKPKLLAIRLQPKMAFAIRRMVCMGGHKKSVFISDEIDRPRVCVTNYVCIAPVGFTTETRKNRRLYL